MSKRNEKNAHLVEPTWGQSDDGGPPLTELSASVAGPLSPAMFPLPVAETLTCARCFFS